MSEEVTLRGGLSAHPMRDLLNAFSGNGIQSQNRMTWEGPDRLDILAEYLRRNFVGKNEDRDEDFRNSQSLAQDSQRGPALSFR
jgi:hypothetical protein